MPKKIGIGAGLYGKIILYILKFNIHTTVGNVLFMGGLTDLWIFNL
jgi:hypothetical protein